MISTDAIYMGIDPTSSHKAFSFAALNKDLRLVALADVESDELADFLSQQKAVVAAVNSPSHVNYGLVRKKLEDEATGHGQHQIRGADIRMAEYELRERGITVTGTPGRVEGCPAWVQAGFSLYSQLSNLGFYPSPMPQARYQWLETHPHACFCVLLEQNPLTRSTLEGRLQRQAILYELGVGIQDTMVFFEEITRFKLLKGVLPWEMIHTPGALDLLAAAYTAWMTVHKPEEVSRLGTTDEGLITLPGILREKYK